MKNKQHVQNVSVCLRCGAIGKHQTSDCREEIPSIQSLQAQIQTRIDFALSHVPSGWEKDEFGYYQPNSNTEKNIPTETNQPNCSNCGDFGHTANDCPRPKREEIYMKFGESLKQTGQIANEEREDILNWIETEFY